MRKVTLHRETLRLVSSQATGRNMKEQGATAAPFGSERICDIEPPACHTCTCIIC
jgi:hypothetical protein